MKTISIYNFEELTPEAQLNAIRKERTLLEMNDSDLALDWAIDDCSLFEPKHQEMTAILGDDYYNQSLSSDGYGQFVFKNKRKGIRVNLDEETLRFSRALEITNNSMFLKWCGIPEKFHNFLSYTFCDTTDSTYLEFDWDLLPDDLIESENELIQASQNAMNKFDELVDEIKARISSGYKEYFSDDNVREKLEGLSNVWYHEDGTKCNLSQIKN